MDAFKEAHVIKMAEYWNYNMTAENKVIWTYFDSSPSKMCLSLLFNQRKSREEIWYKIDHKPSSSPLHVTVGLTCATRTMIATSVHRRTFYLEYRFQFWINKGPRWLSLIKRWHQGLKLWYHWFESIARFVDRGFESALFLWSLLKSVISFNPCCPINPIAVL